MTIGQWEVLTPIPTLNSSSYTMGGLGSYLGHIYAFIPVTGAGTADGLWRYKIATASWEKVNSEEKSGQPRHMPQINDRLYDLAQGRVYHIDTATYTNVAIPHSSLTYQSRMHGTQFIYWGYNHFNGSVWGFAFGVFDSVANTNTTLGNLSGKNQSMCAYKNRLWFYGEGDSFGATGVLWCYDLANGTLTQKASSPLSTDFSSGIIGMDNRLYVLGGIGNSMFLIYDIPSNTWLSRSSQPNSGESSSTWTAYNGYLYVLHKLGVAPFNRFNRYHATDVIESGDPLVATIAESEVEVEIEIPWFRTHPLPIPTRGGFTIDDDAHRANARQLDAWANDPIEDFGEVIEVELGDDER